VSCTGVLLVLTLATLLPLSSEATVSGPAAGRRTSRVWTSHAGDAERDARVTTRIVRHHENFPLLSQLRLRGGVGPLGLVVLTPEYAGVEFDGRNCRCLTDCTCAHCWRRNQGYKIDKNIVPSFIIDNMQDAGNAHPDTLPSWPPPHGAGADVVTVQKSNRTALEHAIFGPPTTEEQQDLLRIQQELPEQGGDDTEQVEGSDTRVVQADEEETEEENREHLGGARGGGCGGGGWGGG